MLGTQAHSSEHLALLPSVWFFSTMCGKLSLPSLGLKPHSGFTWISRVSLFSQRTSTCVRGSKDPCRRETTDFLGLARMRSWSRRQPREIHTSDARSICAAFIAPPSFPSWSCKDFVARWLDSFANSQRVTSVTQRAA